jgi:hypothetical protein
MEQELREIGFDPNIIYLDWPALGAERQPDAREDGTVIDFQRYKILRTMRLVMNVH